jgi:DNA helicase-2/ATP-dependent DNA helicase PcrA
MVNPDDEQAWRRVLQTPPKGIGTTTIQQLEQEARTQNRSIGRVLQNLESAPSLPKLAKAKLAPAAEFIAALRRKLEGLDLVQKVEIVLENSGLIPFYEHYNEEEAEDRLTNLGQLVDAARDRLKEHEEYDLTEFLSEVALVSDIDEYDKSVERVTLMTLHAAKGLEYPVVFIVGVEEKLLPHSRSMGSPGELEEERRLFYVGLTRARERLYLTYSQTRYLYNHLEFQEPSRFLRDIAPEHIRGWSLPGRASTARTMLFDDEDQDQTYRPPEKPVYRPQRASRSAAATPSVVNIMIPYQIGDLVEHPDFGRGVVTAKSGDLEDLKIRVAFEGMGSKLLAVKFAQLKKVP